MSTDTEHPEVHKQEEEKPAADTKGDVGNKTFTKGGDDQIAEMKKKVGAFLEVGLKSYDTAMKKFRSKVKPLPENASSFEKLVYWQDPRLSGAALLLVCTVFFFPSLFSLSWLVTLLLVWVSANTAFHLAMKTLTYLNIISKSEDQHAYMLFAKLVTERYLTPELLGNVAKNVADELDVARVFLLKVLSCNSWEYTGATLFVLYFTRVLTNLVGNFTATFLIAFSILTLPLLSVVFDEELDNVKKQVLVHSRTGVKTVLASLPPAARKYVPEKVNTFANAKQD